MLKEIRIFGQYLGPLGGENPVDEFRKRIKLPGNGPRGIAVVGTKAYVVEYFSDTIAVVDLMGRKNDETIHLGDEPKPTLVRKGEMYFNDATLCYEHWQSCSTCHPDGRADALNWDLLNDGGGTPRNTKSLLKSHLTPPAMATGVRKSAEMSVKTGIEHILFAEEEYEEEAKAIYAYIKALKPVPSPYLVNGKLSKAALRGKKVFENDDVGCAICHPAPLYTDKAMHVVVPSSSYEKEKFDTPTLLEIWRTPPYMNDGRFTNLKDLLIKGDHGSSMGGVKKLPKQQVDDLVEFLLSL
jgi:cytochrome c peroxidase